MQKVAVGPAVCALVALGSGYAFADASPGAPQGEGAGVQVTEEQIVAGAARTTH
jgi:hypothetical protein